MKAGDYEAISAIQSDVLGYLRNHPNAADSVEGIRQWWLLAEMARRSSARVQAALDELVAADLVDCRVMEDGRLVYSVRHPISKSAETAT
jgi:hypothetical protein